MTKVKTNHSLSFWTIIYILITLALTGCVNKNTDIYNQVPMQKEVVGIGANIRAWRDHRGIFYYVDNQGNPTREPVYLAKKTCKPKRSIVIFHGSDLTFGDLIGGNDNEKRAAIELQCAERERWEQGGRNRRRR